MLTQRKMELAATEEASKASPEEQKQVCMPCDVSVSASRPTPSHLALSHSTCLSALVACSLVCASNCTPRGCAAA